ncbi:MAG: UvrD-helicase domain-containing protein [Tessaracoccus sp.]
MNVFDLSAPLPDSTVILEASAGTGKTYTIAALVCRFIAEQGRDIGDLLLITFGNAASNELRERVFAALVDVESALAAFLENGTPPTDEVARLLCAADVGPRRDRLRDALDRFDEATIVTTHAFCQAMLRSLGVLGDHDPAERLLPDAVRLIEQCATDQYLHDIGPSASGEPPAITPKVALTIGREACLSQMVLHPAGSPEAEFGDRVRQRFAARKRELGVVTYDDLILRLHAVLREPASGDMAIEVLRRRYPVVLVDEFQDTDPWQWEIIEKAFISDDRPTILVGDPKQSIYGFRNADVLSYLDATSKARNRFSLPKNYRSDQALIDGVGELFGTVRLGDPRITVSPVESRNAGSRLQLPGTPARVWVRGFSATDPATIPESIIEQDLLSQVRRLLAEARITDPHHPDRDRAVALGDIVVLTRTGRRAEQLCRFLIDAGHPAVLMGQQSVWRQQAARDWLVLLQAMAQPATSANRKAALTDLIGADLAGLADPSSPVAATVSALIRELAHQYDAGGIAQVFTTLRLRRNVDARLLATPGGERRLTDLEHVAELLGERNAESLEAAAVWLESRIESPEESEAPIRAETDADAIRLMTMHSAKGLEFPIVLLPEVSRTTVITYRPFPLIEDDRRVLYVGGKPARNSRLERELTRQLRDEELRLLYVGLTRAKHLAIAWHVDDNRSTTSPMSALLYRDPASPELASRYSPGSLRVSFDPQRVRLEGVSASAQDSTAAASRATPSRAMQPSAPGVLTRRIDTTWRRTSYTGLTQVLHDAPPERSDEPTELEALPGDPALTVASPMAELPSGAAFGTLVHAALERLDWSEQRLASDAARIATELGTRSGFSPAQCRTLAASLEALCRTPLAPLTEATLSELGTAARLAELDFDLPLADQGRPATVGELTSLMAQHLDRDDPLAEYPSRLAATEAADGVLNGFLTGSIDAVLRVPGGGFLVVDYKTNNLSPSPEVPQILGHYTPDAMAEAMMQAHYPLQALLYCAALHRYLGLRLRGYDPHRHLGGVGYLFVRGMAGPETPVVSGTRCGVFAWHPSPELVIATSDLLGGMA